MSEQKNGADGNAMGSNKGAEVHGSAQSGGIYTPNPPNTPKNVQMLHPPQQQPMVYNISSPSYQTAQHHSQPPSVQGHYVNEHQHHMTSPLNYGKQGQGDQSANAVHIVVSSSSNHQPQQMGMQTQNEHLQELPRQRYPQQQQAHGPPPRSNAQDRRSRDNISQPVYTAYQSVPQQHTPQMQQTMSTGQPQQMHQQSQQGMAIPQSPQQPHAQQQIYYQQRQDIGQPQQLGAPPAPHPIHQSISSQNPAFQIQHTSRSNAPSRNITIQQGVVASMPTKPQNQQHQQPQQYMGSTVPQQNTQKQSESIIAQQSPYNQTNNSGQQAQQMNIQNQTQHYAPISLQPPQQSGRNMLSPHTPQQQLLSNSGGEAQLQSQGTSPNNLSGHMSIPQQPPHASHQVVEQHQIPTTIYQQHQQSQQASQQQYLQQQVQSFTAPPTPHPPQQQHQAAPPTFIVTHGAPPAGASGVQGSQQPQMQRIYIQQQGAPPQQHIIMGHPSQLPMQGTVVHAGPPPPPTAHIAVAQQPIPAQAISHQPQPVAYNGSDRFYVNSVIAATAAISNPNNETTVINPKEKYRELKRKLKFLVYENEYYQEELRNLQRKLLKLSRDKNFLLDRLGNHETNSTESSDDSEASVKTLEERAPKQRKRTKPAPGRKKGTAVTATGSATSSTNGSVLSKRGSSSMLKTKGEAPQSNSEGAKVSAAGSTDSLATTSSQCTVATTTVKIEDFGSQVTDSQAGQGQPLSASVSDTPGSQAGSASNFASSSNTGPHPFPSSSNGVAIMPESAMSTSEVLNQFSQDDMLLMRKTPVRQMKLTDMFARAASAAGKNNAVNKKAKALHKTDIVVPGTSSDEVKENLPVSPAVGSTDGESEPAAKRIKSSDDAVHRSFSERLTDTLQDGAWNKLLMPEFNRKYMREIFGFLEKNETKGTKIFPPRDLIFNAFNLTPFDQIRVVLIGQDPYHNDDQAHGLCFSVPPGVRPPPSLQNMYKELAKEIPDFKHPGHGCLVGWATQGVFMLNATLTVEAHKANSHSDIGWQKFTDTVIKLVSERSNGVVFLLCGTFAQKKECLVDLKKHKVVKSAHPSPLSYTKFKDSRSFIRTNEALIALGREPINWALL